MGQANAMSQQVSTATLLAALDVLCVASSCRLMLTQNMATARTNHFPNATMHLQLRQLLKVPETSLKQSFVVQLE